ncbi:MAG: hypothetical protein ACEQR8_04805 [Cypionkella sp.]
MPAPDSTAKAALNSHFSAAWFIHLDIDGDPLRVTTFGADVVVSGSGDSELDGTYVSRDGRFIEVSEISNSEGGSDTRTITLSGITSIDVDLVADIADRSLWQGRLARIWCRIYDADGVTAQGAIFPVDTGYMSSVQIIAGAETQTMKLSIENYLAFYSEASNRSYQNQADYDAADTSAAATMAAANGLQRGSGASAGIGGDDGPRIQVDQPFQ